MLNYRRFSRAFTLIELLTVVAIIGILAALLIPAVGAVRTSAQKSGGVNALRQTGAAINLFTQEHNGTFPGPLWPGQIPIYEPDRDEEDGRLSNFLASYLDVPANATPPYRVEALIPPAFPIDELGSEPRTFVMNTKAENPNSAEIINVWGVHPALAKNDSETVAGNVYQIIDPSRTWAVMDADQQHPDVTGKGWASSTPAKPIHGSVRNTLFFDGHVEAVDVSIGLP
ncbi:type II secretion system protein [Cerasicoccus arenae]|nr:type II secretion system protein [Cerasicoccus arenae]MBK1857556.1 type II secretion system protein [Cerasicoccus arenae]